MAGGKNTVEIIRDVSKALKVASPSELKEEAVKVLNMMDDYKEPVPPFQHITKEQAQKAFDDLEKQYGFVIWSTLLAGTDEACVDMVQSDPDYYLEYSEDAIRQLTIEANNEECEFLMEEFAKISVNSLVVTGTIARWDGPKPAFGIRKSLKDLFEAFTGNGCVLYIKDGELRGENHHHDGIDYYTFYTCKKGVNPEFTRFRYIDQKSISDDVESLVPALVKHFGWKLEKCDADIG